jgi:hypothetical protein
MDAFAAGVQGIAGRSKTARKKADARARRAVPRMPRQIVANTQKTNAVFAGGIDARVEKYVLSQLPILGSGDPLDLEALELGIQRLEYEVEAIATARRKAILTQAKKAIDAARASAKKLLGIDLPEDSYATAQAMADRSVERLKAAGAAQARLIRRAIREYREGTSMREAIKSTLWLSRLRGRIIAHDEIFNLYRDTFGRSCMLSGSSEGVYVTAKDDRVRATHQANEGKHFPWDRPPSTLREVNCRCMLVPVEVLR